MSNKEKAPLLPEVGYQDFTKNLKTGRAQGLYLFHGEETYLLDKALQVLEENVLGEGMAEFNRTVLEGKGLALQALADAIDALPMLGGGRLILVNDYDVFQANEDERKTLMALLVDLPEDLCLLFLFRHLPYKPDGRKKKWIAFLKEQAKVVHFAPQSQAELMRWIQRRFASEGKVIDPHDVQYLLFLCGGLMQNLVSEMDKLTLATEEAQITKALIDAVAVPQLDAVLFRMSDALLARQSDTALQILGDLLLMQEAPIKILSVLGKQFRQLYVAKLALASSKTHEQLAEMLHLRFPYLARRLMQTARGVSLDVLRLGVLRCAETDRAMKSSTGTDPEALLVSLVLELSFVLA